MSHTPQEQVRTAEKPLPGEMPLGSLLRRPALALLGCALLVALPLLWLWPADPVRTGQGLIRLGLSAALTGAAWAALGRAGERR